MTEYNVVLLYSLKTNGWKKVPSWDYDRVVQYLTPDHYGFRFELRKKNIIRGEWKKDVIIEVLQRSGIYYCNCYIETLEDLLIKPKKNEFLIKQMENMGVNRIVRTIKGDLTFPFYENDTLIDSGGNVIEC